MRAFTYAHTQTQKNPKRRKKKTRSAEPHTEKPYETSQVSSAVIHPGGNRDLSHWNSSKVDEEEDEEKTKKKKEGEGEKKEVEVMQ